MYYVVDETEETLWERPEADDLADEVGTRNRR